MGKFKSLVGRKFGKLLVISFEGIRNHKSYYRCRCDCGSECVVMGGNLTRGHTTSCGCRRKEFSLQTKTTHGLCHSKIYAIWADIKARCFNINNLAYPRYGGRGITMFPAWINDVQAFCIYVSALPHYGEKGYSLDRIDNDGDYCPGNLRWATNSEQARNRRSNRVVEYEGEQMTLAEVSDKTGISISTLWARLNAGDTGERLFRPVRKISRK